VPPVPVPSGSVEALQDAMMAGNQISPDRANDERREKRDCVLIDAFLGQAQPHERVCPDQFIGGRLEFLGRLVINTVKLYIHRSTGVTGGCRRAQPQEAEMVGDTRAACVAHSKAGDLPCTRRLLINRMARTAMPCARRFDYRASMIGIACRSISVRTIVAVR
jgi:hypothetical protein